ncbi:cytochrome c oxidase subunit 4 isoform 1, mitochondrial-like [Osmia bicornis bicornis]|uniref:cytochrome c oxidase subunit 4 isoform 1, mitochondrial-like n=1 Tax=Osmia bicornis bicornis TaxID=1437191 RepID=UPI0010FA2E3E|nr:cytochrome c oxidase subunit 4 isoform 1, mitochondrial-like [Osmia bicornis bicornis]XP_029048463.1 cytochrome c oxidase subunit 4 isoform 1, mitochondrial-like [Osmia bicornis bicornis]
MANKLFLFRLRQSVPYMCTRGMALPGPVFPDKIGNRDIVGNGYNGEPTYLDRVDFPMPAIRFKANTPDVMALREKEKGDWKKLSIEEKKALYRASYRQTFSEFLAPSGDWKACLGYTLMGCAFSIWLFMFLKTYAYPPLPESFSEESRLAQLERMQILEVNPITGISSKK